MSSEHIFALAQKLALDMSDVKVGEELLRELFKANALSPAIQEIIEQNKKMKSKLDRFNSWATDIQVEMLRGFNLRDDENGLAKMSKEELVNYLENDYLPEIWEDVNNDKIYTECEYYFQLLEFDYDSWADKIIEKKEFLLANPNIINQDLEGDEEISEEEENEEEIPLGDKIIADEQTEFEAEYQR
jgi:hypothetical protein